MSADNGIYIAKFVDGYRVIEASAIDNLSYYPADSEENKKEWKSYFVKAKKFKTKDEALEYAKKLYNEPDSFFEYGIVDLGEGTEWDCMSELVKKFERN